MKNILLTCTTLILMGLASCVAPLPVTSPNNGTLNQGDARNYVMIMHGESCDTENVASNMYVENHHETATITVVVYISWTENNQPRYENKTVIVGPDSKTLIGCDYRNGTYLKMEIVNAQFN